MSATTTQNLNPDFKTDLGSAASAPLMNFGLIVSVGAAFAVAGIILGWFFVPGWPVSFGIALGYILAVANLVFLTKIIAKMLNQNYSSPARTVALVVAKLAFIVGTFYLAFRLLNVDALAFAGGYFCLMMALTLLKGRTNPA